MNMDKEWRDIPNSQGKYRISLSTKECLCENTDYRGSGTAKTIPNTINPNGRIMWNLIIDGVKYYKQAAYWVAITYPEMIENEQFDGAEIDHKDTDRLNNQPSNLRWVTRKDNCLNPLTLVHNSNSKKGKVLSESTKKKISQSQKERLKDNPELCGAKKYVLQYSLENNLIGIYNSTAEAERVTKISHQNISKAATGKYKSAGGFLWKYKEKEAV